MFQNRCLQTVWLLGAIAAIMAHAAAANADETQPAPRGTPGIIIEPRPRGGDDADRPGDAPAPSEQRPGSERRGCPVNNRPLELLV